MENNVRKRTRVILNVMCLLKSTIDQNSITNISNSMVFSKDTSHLDGYNENSNYPSSITQFGVPKLPRAYETHPSKSHCARQPRGHLQPSVDNLQAQRLTRKLEPRKLTRGPRPKSKACFAL